MGYRLGVDLGTTYTAAAVLRDGGTPEVVPLGTRSAAVPSVLFLSPDLGDLLVGEAAERRAVTDPDRVVRQFKRRIGDPTPLLIDPARDSTKAAGTRTAEYAAHDLAAVLIQWVVARVSEREGAKPADIAVTHPATWGPHKKDLIRGALALRGLRDVTFVSEPEAAARTYAFSGRLAPDATLAVYDLGGGTFDAALLRPTGDGGFESVGRPHGLPELGGIDFDDAILNHVLTAVGPEAAAVDAGDPVIVPALARLRRECVDAKEALSADTTTEIPVLLPDIRTNVRLTRAELEAMIAPRVRMTIEALEATLASAGLTAADLTNVVLTGGSSRIPVVAQMLSAHLGAPVSLDRDIDPKMAVAIGAVLALGSPVVSPAGRPDPAVAGFAPVDLPPVADASVGPDKSPPAPEPEPAAAAAAARADLPTARGGGAPGLAPIPARPARGTGSLTGADGGGLPAPRSRLRPKRALTLLAVTTALMLGAGVGVSAIGDLGGEGSTATPVRTDGLDMAKPAKKGQDAKVSDAKGSGAKASDAGSGGAASGTGSATATAPASFRQPEAAGGNAGADEVTAATAQSAAAPAPARTAAQQASATRKAATKPATQSGSTEAHAPVTVEEFETPSVAAIEAESAGTSAPDSAPAGPASSSDSQSPSSDAGSSDAGGWSEPAAPAADSAPAAADGGPSGFSETAPPEAP